MKRPQNRAFFYDDPSADADFEYWTQVAHWTIEETAALSLGKDPERVSTKTLWPYRNFVFGRQYARRLELCKRAQGARKLYPLLEEGALINPLAVLPKYFLRWATDIGLEIPERLKEAVIQRHGPPDQRRPNFDYRDIAETSALKARVAFLEQELAKSPPKPKPQSAVTRERNTLLKIILGLAMDQYGYQPHAPRNATAGEIAGDLDGQGISVSEDTVRKYLNDASEFAPPRYPA